MTAVLNWYRRCLNIMGTGYDRRPAGRNVKHCESRTDLIFCYFFAILRSHATIPNNELQFW